MRKFTVLFDLNTVENSCLVALVFCLSAIGHMLWYEQISVTYSSVAFVTFVGLLFIYSTAFFALMIEAKIEGQERPILQKGKTISTSAQKELDILHEKTGLVAHKVCPSLHFNGPVKISDDPEAAEVERLLVKYSSSGYVFTKKSSLIIGNLSTITTKQDRVERRRSRFFVVNSNDTEQ